jgi:mono/diheme cytochrome c family protein
MTPNADGSYPPPPQDAGGHTWHHADQLLVSIVLEGSDFPQSRMPAFGETLSEDEVMSILEYYKSLWGPQERDVQWNATWRAQQQP